MKPSNEASSPLFLHEPWNVFLKVSVMPPHRKRYWLTPPVDDPVALAEQICMECGIYQAAPTLYEQGTHVMSCDEMTGVQTLERLHPSLPMLPGHVEREEFEYLRHGTQSLIANLEVATGQIIAPTIGPRRTEEDFVAHIEQTIQTDPEAAWIFVTDQREHPSIGDVGISGREVLRYPGGSGHQKQKWTSRLNGNTCNLSL
jgi:DDE superfamily endonuclease